ncbi:MAG: TadE/TadG family type IV pilus assembly protein [Candidatus Saccharibacteria bacterium]
MKKIRYDHQRGSITLEFVSICILFILVFTGICNCATLLRDKLTLIAAAREGGRVLAITEDEAMCMNKTYGILSKGGIEATRAQVEANYSGSIASVSISYDAPVALPMMATLVGGEPGADTLRLSSSISFSTGELTDPDR